MFIGVFFYFLSELFASRPAVSLSNELTLGKVRWS